MKLLKLFFLFIIVVTFCSCSTTKDSISPSINLISESDYHQTISLYSKQKQIYSGLYNTMDLTVTILNSKVTDAQTDQHARIYIWDANKYTQEKVKVAERLSKEAEFFISFFTPDRKHDDLHKNQTLWKIFLDVDGKRHEGKTKKIKLLTEELQGIYAFHNRFSTPYSVVFPVPMKQIESAKEIKITITGPVGSATLEY